MKKYMKNKRLIIPTLALIGATALAGGTAYAQEIRNNRPFRHMSEEQMNFVHDNVNFRQDKLGEERGFRGGKIKVGQREQYRDLFEVDDYEVFKTATEGTRIAEFIDTEEKFITFVEAHKLMEEGDFQGARDLMDGSGFEGRGMMHR